MLHFTNMKLIYAQAIFNINALRGDSQPASKPFNAQGQQVQQYPPNTTSTACSQFNPFNLPPPISTTPPPTVDLRSLPPPPLPITPLRSSSEVPTIPPPPVANSGGVGMLKKPPLSAATGPRPTPPTPLKAPAKSMPAKVSAKPLAFIPPTQEMLQEKVRVLPVGQAKPGLNSAASASEEESRAFVEYINTSTALQQDPDINGILPIKANSPDIYTVVSEGWLLWYANET
jgi:hypothetical protein